PGKVRADLQKPRSGEDAARQQLWRKGRPCKIPGADARRGRQKEHRRSDSPALSFLKDSFYTAISEYVSTLTGADIRCSILDPRLLMYCFWRCSINVLYEANISSNISSSGFSVERCRTYAML